MTTALSTRPMFYGGMDPITMNRLETLVTNVTTLQRERLNRISTIDPRRDLDAECGYPSGGLTPEEYYDLIRREPAARLVNDFFPLECWKQDPYVYETSDSDDETEWEAARRELSRWMKVEPSYLVQDKGDPINFFLLQADMLSGYGRHGIVLFDLKDGKDWSEPVTPRRGMEFKGPPRAFPEHLARVNAFDMDPDSPRFRLPLSYMVTFSDPYETERSYINEPSATVYVHWSRVLHNMDVWHTAAPSRCFAKPRLEPCRDPILDIRKVRGGSAEMYWGGARPGTHFGTHPQLGADVDVNVDDMRDMYEEYLDGLQRALFTSGMFAEQLAPQVVDPTPQIMAQMQSIALVMRTPFRILLGSERGELASGDDRKKHNGNIMSRCNTYLTSQVVGGFYDRLINYGCLPKPRKGYLCEWPELESLNATEKAGNLLVRTQAYGMYTQSGMEAVVPPKEYMTKWDDMTEEEADEVLAASVDSQDGQSDTPAPLLGLVGGLTGMLEMFQGFADGAISEETLAQLIMLFYKVPEEKAYQIIADGLPDPPEGSPRDLPPLPPMKGPGAAKGPLVKNALVVNWLLEKGLSYDDLQ